MLREIHPHDLLPGDVLLYKGTAFISRAIQFFDGTDYSHAGLYLGDDQVGEAVATGLVRQSVKDSVHDVWVDVFRLVELVPSMDPVLTIGNAYIDEGNRYGYEQILMLVLLCLTRKIRLTPTLRVLVRTALDAAGAVLIQMMDQKRQPMICSEYVYRAFDEALPEANDAYALTINKPVADAPVRAIGGPAVKGQGVHPQSLLALHNASLGNAWLGQPVMREPEEPVRGEPGDRSEEIQFLIGAYLSEVQAAPQKDVRTTEPEVSLIELNQSIDDFAAKLYEAAHPPDTRGDIDISAKVTVYAEFLTKTASDFVTPGDLLKTQSLFKVGKLIM